jgi:hypothetical protein
MKSAYELAMERLGKSSPSRVLTASQKADLAEIDSLYRARLAGEELAFADRIKAATEAGNWEETETLRAQLAQERERLEGEKEAKKERVRNAA